MSRYRFVAAEKAAARAVSAACAVLEVSRSAYYQWSPQTPSVRQRRDAELGERIVRIHAESRGTYGAPRIHQELRHQGIVCGHKRVARLMSLRGLVGRFKRRFKRTYLGVQPMRPKNCVRQIGSSPRYSGLFNVTTPTRPCFS